MTLLACLAAGAQTTYEPKFKGDPAKSESEAGGVRVHAHGSTRAKAVQEKEQQVRPVAG